MSSHLTVIRQRLRFGLRLSALYKYLIGIDWRWLWAGTHSTARRVYTVYEWVSDRSCWLGSVCTDLDRVMDLKTVWGSTIHGKLQTARPDEKGTAWRGSHYFVQRCMPNRLRGMWMCLLGLLQSAFSPQFR